MHGRMTAALAASLVITAGLFWIMQAAIDQGDITVDPHTPGPVVELVRLERDETVTIQDQDKPEPPPKVEPEPQQKNDHRHRGRFL